MSYNSDPNLCHKLNLSWLCLSDFTYGPLFLISNLLVEYVNAFQWKEALSSFDFIVLGLSIISLHKHPSTNYWLFNWVDFLLIIAFYI